MSKFYTSLIIFFLLFCVVSLFCQCSLPLYLHFCFLLQPFLGFANVLCPLIYIFFCFVSVARFAKCSMPLYLYCFSFLLCLRLGILPLFYAFLFIAFFLLFCVCGLVLPMFVPLSFSFFSFLLCLWLGFADVLCLFIYIFSFSLLPVPWFCQCSMPLFYIFSFLLCLCRCFAKIP